MNYKFQNYSHIHLIMRAFLAYNSYDYDDRENVISATSIMKPTQMMALEIANKDADRIIDLEDMIPSVYGTSLHTQLETALKHINNDLWRELGIDEPEKLEILAEERKETKIDDYIVSGKFDVMFKYKDSKWQLGDLKSLSVWGVMIDPEKKQDEWRKQMSIYRYLNQDKDIDDKAVIMTVYTDWSASDSVIKEKQGYPKSRFDVFEIELWSLYETEDYLKKKIAGLKLALSTYEKTGKEDTGFRCSDEELWIRPGGWAYYAKSSNKRATKICNTEEEANKMLLKAKDNSAYIEERKGEAKRCSYCKVTKFCKQYSELLVKGLVS